MLPGHTSQGLGSEVLKVHDRVAWPLGVAMLRVPASAPEAVAELAPGKMVSVWADDWTVGSGLRSEVCQPWCTVADPTQSAM